MSTPRNYVPVHASGITVHDMCTSHTVQISYQYSTVHRGTVRYTKAPVWVRKKDLIMLV